MTVYSNPQKTIVYDSADQLSLTYYESFKSMKKFRLTGGVGNQLFIYAAGKYYEARTGSEVIFDLTDRFREKSVHKSDIRQLGLPGNFNNNIVDILKAKKSRFEIGRGIYKTSQKIYSSSVVGYDPNLEFWSPFEEFRGYFQCFTYASHPAVSHNLTLNKFHSDNKYFMRIANLIMTENTIAIHIRRGDYHQNRITHGFLATDYFRDAIDLIITENSFIKFKNIVLFSDSPSEAISILNQIDHKLNLIVIDRKKLRDVDSLVLFSKSNFSVIANSTFSWWGAWLGEKEKFIVAPKKWFRNLEDPKYLIPQDWKVIGSSWTE